MKLTSKHNTKLLSFTLTVLACCPLLIRCQSAREYERPKRTVGFLFRSFVDAFKTQRQPEPMVHSYQPLKQTKASTSHSTLQSAKDELLASSKNIFEQKKNLFKTPSTRAQEMHLVNQILGTNSVLNTPAKTQPLDELCNQDSKQTYPPVNHNPTPPQSSAHHSSQTFNNVPLQAHDHQNPLTDPSQHFHKSNSFNSSPASKSNPLTHSAPYSNQYSQMPFKAHIIVLPFQGNNDEMTRFPEFNTQPPTPVVPSPVNYQAEILLQPSAISTEGKHDSARFSENNGWRDVDEIISRVNKKLSIKSGENKDVDNAKVLVTPYNLAARPEENHSRHSDTNPSGIESGQGENYSVEDNRRNQILDCCKDHRLPLFVPQAQYNSYNLESYPNHHVEVDRTFNLDPTFTLKQYEVASDQTYPTQNFDDYQYVQVVHHNTNSDIQNEEFNRSNLSHDYVPQNSGEVVRFEKNLFGDDHLTYEDSEKDVKNLNIEKFSFGNIQNYPTKIGRLPGFLAKY